MNEDGNNTSQYSLLYSTCGLKAQDSQSGDLISIPTIPLTIYYVLLVKSLIFSTCLQHEDNSALMDILGMK